MIDLIVQNREQLTTVCRKHRVKTLELFGSAANGAWDAARSDLDFLVDFLPLEDGRLAPDYFGLLHDLEDLFHRKIDLVMLRAIRNPYFLIGVNENRKVLYAA